MVTTLIATYKNRALLLDKDLPLQPKTKVKITIDLPAKDEKKSFLEQAVELDFDAPSDWSKRVDEYLYGVNKCQMPN
ncbi:MAG: hypothetical protein A2X61_12845 [Ignavibacteria bacterium GWB2_35_12]|nr:MAG: hypothetical protein A2X63_03790 [Ignavibacteria bacterium GWA2_35_8]OGU41512.1 MAG: hypothetical protein A2X61_12845 [Ignavibacteria bacterium GWB2_35_12]OGU92999.1 MAG: hypothetical protein A2220_15770 [Ignavibacteria bacterium RIFOXYA2_FULL_35_10]OGV22986.1 MAG: hypothetical protein A2475_10315 [Ignavibacteria bacterium RIFOXYC2_FULL_35_21]